MRIHQKHFQLSTFTSERNFPSLSKKTQQLHQKIKVRNFSEENFSKTFSIFNFFHSSSIFLFDFLVTDENNKFNPFPRPDWMCHPYHGTSIRSSRKVEEVKDRQENRSSLVTQQEEVSLRCSFSASDSSSVSRKCFRLLTK